MNSGCNQKLAPLLREPKDAVRAVMERLEQIAQLRDLERVVLPGIDAERERVLMKIAQLRIQLGLHSMRPHFQTQTAKGNHV